LLFPAGDRKNGTAKNVVHPMTCCSSFQITIRATGEESTSGKYKYQALPRTERAFPPADSNTALEFERKRERQRDRGRLACPSGFGDGRCRKRGPGGVVIVVVVVAVGLLFSLYGEHSSTSKQHYRLYN
jgi:hypothetical protein